MSHLTTSGVNGNLSPSVNDVVAAGVGRAMLLAEGLPLTPDPVDIGVVQKEDGVIGRFRGTDTGRATFEG